MLCTDTNTCKSANPQQHTCFVSGSSLPSCAAAAAFSCTILGQLYRPAPAGLKQDQEAWLGHAAGEGLGLHRKADVIKLATTALPLVVVWTEERDSSRYQK